MPDSAPETPTEIVDGHAGEQALAALRRFGVDTMFTLNGGHVWPLYEAARHQGVRVIDTRHEQTATFAAEGYAKLTRTPGLAVLTAGPGITNGVSAITTASTSTVRRSWCSAGRAPEARWGSGSLQEFDHVPVVSVDHQAGRDHQGPHHGGCRRSMRRHATGVPPRTEARCSATSRSTCSVRRPAPCPRSSSPEAPSPTRPRMAAARRVDARLEPSVPAIIVGSDVYWAGAWGELRAVAEAFRVPCFFNGSGPGHVLPGRRSSWRSCAPVAGSRPRPTWWW